MRTGNITNTNAPSSKILETSVSGIVFGDRNISSSATGDATDIMDRAGVEDILGVIALPDHASAHEVGGDDIIDVAGLSGLLADAQTPISHGSTHVMGAADEVDITHDLCSSVHTACTKGSFNALITDDTLLGSNDVVNDLTTGGTNVPLAAQQGVVLAGLITTGLKTSELLYVRDEKTSGTAGGGSVGLAWTTRDLNTVKVNGITGASVTSNIVTLPAGTYWCEFSAPMLSPSFSVNNGHKLRLRDVDSNITLVVGTNARCTQSLSTDTQSLATGNGYFTLLIETDVELQHYSTGTRASDGLGVAVSSGEVEVYASLTIWKVA